MILISDEIFLTEKQTNKRTEVFHEALTDLKRHNKMKQRIALTAYMYDKCCVGVATNTATYLL